MAAQHLGLDRGPGQVATGVDAVAVGVGGDPSGQLLDHLAVAGDVAQLAGLTLVADHGHGEGPALAGLADHVGGGHPGLVEDHLAELPGDPVDHLQRALLDARLVHADGEGGDALVLGDVGVGAGEDEAPVGEVGVAGPDLVPGDDVVVAVADRPGAERGEVGAGVGLAEALAPAVPAVDDAGQEAAADVLVAMVEDAEHEVAEARAGRGAGGGELVVDDHVVDAGQPLAADLGRPRQAEEPAVVEGLVPGGLALPVLVRRGGGGQVRVVVDQPGPEAGPELGLLGRVTEVHGGTPSFGWRRPCWGSSNSTQ